MSTSVAHACRNRLGEGPIWDSRSGCVVWLDILRPTLFRLDLATGRVHETRLEIMVSSLATDASGHGLCGSTAHGFEQIDPESGTTRLLCPVENDRPDNRSNDGRCDPQGRFWFGTMENAEGNRSGALYSVDTGLRVTRHIAGLGIPNTLAWSPCGRYFYFADSMAQLIWRYEWDAAAGSLGKREVFVSLKGTDIYPDGSAMDEEGFLWNAQWNGWRVVRYAPDGTEDRVVSMPVACPTSCTFAGEKLDRLFVTSARKGQTDEELSRQPDAGALFEIDAPGVTGMPVPGFGANPAATSSLT